MCRSPSLKRPLDAVPETQELSFSRRDMVRSDKERAKRQAYRKSSSHQARARAIAARWASAIADEVAKADEVFVDFSWQDRRKMAIASFARALEAGFGKMQSYYIASFASRVSEKCVRLWIKEWHL